LRSVHIYRVKIDDIVPEGTLVKKGDFIAQLDRSEISDAIKKADLDLETKRLELEQAKIDTALSLQQARDQLENLEADLLEKKLEVEKSVYEPPVIQKQADASYERAKRSFEQKKKEYQLQLTKARSRIRRSVIQLQKSQQHISMLKEIVSQLTIYAPDEGMVMHRGYYGSKGKGAMISTWEPIVAELPDFSVFISKTFVNEVDIRKIKVDQEVDITFDAFPEKKMTGTVVSVANVGQSMKGSKAKVFEVGIEISGTDKDLKPAMTTGNTIITNQLNETHYLPIECVFSQGDSLNYVFVMKKFNVTKQEVQTGERNNQDIIIKKGLQEDEKVLMIPPENSESLVLNRLISNEDDSSPQQQTANQ
ncbi:MAG: efflux RND transporter periplasmic adaptor subunit, partial [Bacteroidales bacterium]|nr:efflux RND transporter periplasmic adaptor subunit [Bacteroidales bacterium]